MSERVIFHGLTLIHTIRHLRKMWNRVCFSQNIQPVNLCLKGYFLTAWRSKRVCFFSLETTQKGRFIRGGRHTFISKECLSASPPRAFTTHLTVSLVLRIHLCTDAWTKSDEKCCCCFVCLLFFLLLLLLFFVVVFLLLLFFVCFFVCLFLFVFLVYFLLLLFFVVVVVFFCFVFFLFFFCCCCFFLLFFFFFFFFFIVQGHLSGKRVGFQSSDRNAVIWSKKAADHCWSLAGILKRPKEEKKYVCYIFITVWSKHW